MKLVSERVDGIYQAETLLDFAPTSDGTHVAVAEIPGGPEDREWGAIIGFISTTLVSFAYFNWFNVIAM
ncbi:MAG: hypothetical protein GF393_04115 [Armatimonadia bacterium]|nr:hypothetical protein [Armatimonadia bacterium]